MSVVINHHLVIRQDPGIVFVLLPNSIIAVVIEDETTELAVLRPLVSDPQMEADELPPHSTRAAPNTSVFIAATSNVAIQYNFAVIALALAFMDNGDPNDASCSSLSNVSVSPCYDASKAAYPRTEVQSSLLRSLVFAGAITGQLTMGIAGDMMGRRRAMLLTNSFSIIGALGSAMLTWGAPSTIYGVMMICRFLLGVGVGGKYPLAATISKEGSSSGSNKSYEVAKGFFWQTPGAVLPYVVGLLLLLGFGKDNFGAQHKAATSFQFRFLLGLGALPTIASTLLTYHSGESDEYAEVKPGSRNPFRVAAAHPELLRPLAGCGLSWLLYDFVYYGTAFNQVAITDSVFGKADALFDNCWQNIVLSGMGLPGVVSAVLLLKRWSSRKLQLFGFGFLALACTALATAVYADASNGVKFAAFAVLLFALNWGMNVSTYTLPTETFPTEVRTTMFGLSAGMGKVGALVGSASFESIQNGVGLQGVYYVCAAFAVLGLLVTAWLCPHTHEAVEPDPSPIAPADESLNSGTRRTRLLNDSTACSHSG